MQVSDDVATENEATEADRGADGHQSSLVAALRSLERTLSDHTQLLSKRLRRELTVKGSEPTAQTGVGGASSLPAKTGQRGDKVEEQHDDGLPSY